MSVRFLRRLSLPAIAVIALGCFAALAQEIELPPEGGYDPQLGGAYPPPDGVAVVSRDRLEKPAAGVYSICYINAFQTQAEEADWWRRHHAGLLLMQPNGRLVEDQDWPGEYFLDTSSQAKRDAIFAIQEKWVRRCASDGFQAVELDNLDSWTRSSNLLTFADNLGLVRLLTDLAHELGMAAAQKNNAELANKGKVLGGFDFAIAEDCELHDECDAYLEVYGGRLLEIEYADEDPDAFARACRKRGGKIPIVLRDRGLTTPEDEDYRFETC